MKGYVYAIGTAWDEPVKIGVAGSIKKRLAGLQSGNHRELVVMWSAGPFKNPLAAERVLHDALAPARVLGEWFLLPEGTDLSEILHGFEDGRRSVSASEGISAESAAANVAVCTLIDRRSRREGISVGAAMDGLSADFGFKEGELWVLRYRPGRDIGMTKYIRVVRAVWSECGHSISDNWPYAEELTIATELLASLPLEGGGVIDADVFKRAPKYPPGYAEEIEKHRAALAEERAAIMREAEAVQ